MGFDIMIATRQLLITLLATLLSHMPSALLPLAHAESSNQPDQIMLELHATMIKALNRDAEKIAADRKHLLVLADEIVSPHVDFEKMSKLILGKHWRTMNPQQRQRYLSAFKTKVGQSMLALYEPNQQYDLKILGSRLNKKKTKSMVKSQISEKNTGKSYRADYRAHFKANRWLIYDVAVDGISVLQSFKTASASEIEQNGVDALLAQMEANLDPEVKKTMANLEK